MRKHFIKTSLAVLPLVAAITFSPITASAHSKVMPDGGRFDATFYAATYPDVKAAFGTNENLLYQHYLNNGKKEGRLPYDPKETSSGSVSNDGFDPVYYAKANPDVVKVFGNSPEALYNHYLKYGKAEGRLPHANSSFVSNTTTTTTTTDVSSKLLALKSQYPEGMPWSDQSYTVTLIKSLNLTGLQCAGFAFRMSNLVYGEDAPATWYQSSLSFDNIQPGDAINIGNSAGGRHWVMVISKDANGVTVCEGNYNASVHWGRYITKSYINSGLYGIIRRNG